MSSHFLFTGIRMEHSLVRGHVHSPTVISHMHWHSNSIFVLSQNEKKAHRTQQKKKQIECARVHLSFRPVCVVYISSAVVNSLLRRMHKPIATLMFHFSNVRMHFKIFIYIYFFFRRLLTCAKCVLEHDVHN